MSGRYPQWETSRCGRVATSARKRMSKSCVLCRFEGCSWGGRRRHTSRACGIEATRVMLERQQRCQDGKTAKSPNVVVPKLHQSKLSRSSRVGKVLSTASFLFRQLAKHLDYAYWSGF